MFMLTPKSRRCSLGFKGGKFQNNTRKFHFYFYSLMWSLGSVKELALYLSRGRGMNWLTSWSPPRHVFLGQITRLLKLCNDDWMLGRDIKPLRVSSHFGRSKWHLVWGKEADCLTAAGFLHLAVMCFWLPADRQDAERDGPMFWFSLALPVVPWVLLTSVRIKYIFKHFLKGQAFQCRCLWATAWSSAVKKACFF